MQGGDIMDSVYYNANIAKIQTNYFGETFSHKLMISTAFLFHPALSAVEMKQCNYETA